MKKEFVFRLVLAAGIFFLVYQFGIKPVFLDGLNSGRSVESSRSKGLPGSVKGIYDVIVLGEEPEGIAAAVSAARLGAKTLLLSSGRDLGGVVSRSLRANLEVPYGSNGEILNGGILSELVHRLGREFSVQEYISAMDKLVGNEKNIDVKYGAVLDSPIFDSRMLSGLNVTLGGVKSTFNGRMFIDATRNGDLLEACKIPYTTGSEDLNLKDSYMPVSLNFEMEGTEASKIEDLLQDSDGSFKKGLAEYRPLNIDARINNISIYNVQDGRIVVQGLEMANLNVTDKKRMDAAYNDALKEATSLAAFLSSKFEEFKGWKFLKAADEFYIREARHFTGAYQLTVNDVLENKYFINTVAMGSYPVQAGKFANGGVYIAGKPIQYGIPIGCIIPSQFDNLLMVGAKISYTSLAASSAGALGVGIAAGESAGSISVYCLLKDIVPMQIDREKDRAKLDEVRKFLDKPGVNLPEVKFKNKNATNWSYPALRQLLALGLVSGGLGNNFDFARDAKQEDLAILLLNGVYRLDKPSYSLELDSRLRPYFREEPLTREKASEILAAMYDLPDKGSDAYRRVCEKGYLNDVMQLDLKDKKVLTMDDVYYLSAYVIKMYTGKVISD